MSKELDRWGKLAGIPKKQPKQKLDENVVGMGPINPIFAQREPTKYESAFEHFLSERYEGEDIEEDARTDAEEEGYLDGMRDEFYEFIGVDPITESNILDQDFKVLKNQQDILKKVSNFYREKATKLGVDRKLIGDFNAAISALEDAIFKANYDK